MRCPRCYLADIPEGARTCVLCGYSPDARAAGDAAQPTPAARAARGRRTTPAGGSTPTDPHGSQAAAAVAEEVDLVPTELDARRGLSAEVPIEALGREAPEPNVSLPSDE